MRKIDKNAMSAYCTMACNRIAIRQKELNGRILGMSRDIVNKYKNGDLELAQISTENVISAKKMVAALEILNLYIQTVQARVDSLNFEEKLPTNMRKYIASILFCNGRVSIKEVEEVCKQLRKRYGDALDDLKDDVDPRISSRLTPCIPNPSDVSETLQVILRKNGVNCDNTATNPISTMLQDSVMQVPSPFPQAQASGFSPIQSGLPPVPSVLPPAQPGAFPPPQASGFSPSHSDLPPMPSALPPAQPGAFPPAQPGGFSPKQPDVPQLPGALSPTQSGAFPPAQPGAFPPTQSDLPSVPNGLSPKQSDIPQLPGAFPPVHPDVPQLPGAFPPVQPDFPSNVPTFPTAQIPPSSGASSDISDYLKP